MSELVAVEIEKINMEKIRQSIEDKTSGQPIFARWKLSLGNSNRTLSREVRNQRVEELLRERKKTQEIADLLGIGYMVTLRTIRKANIHSHLVKGSEPWAAAVIEAFKEGRTVRELTAEFNASIARIRSVLIEASLIRLRKKTSLLKEKRDQLNQRNRRIEELLREGKKAKEIAASLSISYVITLRVIEKANIHGFLVKGSLPWKAAINKAFKEGKTVRELAAEFNVPTNEIRPVLKEKVYIVHYSSLVSNRVTVMAFSKSEARQKALSMEDVLKSENQEMGPIETRIRVEDLGAVSDENLTPLDCGGGSEEESEESANRGSGDGGGV